MGIKFAANGRTQAVDVRYREKEEIGRPGSEMAKRALKCYVMRGFKLLALPSYIRIRDGGLGGQGM
jgi:hypothetical protein